MEFSFKGTAEEFAGLVSQLKAQVAGGPVYASAPLSSPPPSAFERDPFYPQSVADAGVYRPVRQTNSVSSPKSSIVPDLSIWGDSVPPPSSTLDESEVVRVSFEEIDHGGGVVERRQTKPQSQGQKPSSSQSTLVREGCSAWYSLVSAWEVNLGVEGAEQPNRVALLEEAVMDDGNAILAWIEEAKGLTQSIESIFTDWPIEKSRRVAEHIAQVSSACGFPAISDRLEYTKKYRNILKNS